MVKYSNFLKECNTGDLLLYHDTNCGALLIEYFTKNIYSHISMILKNPTYINKNLMGLYILESGIEKLTDTDGIKKIGVQLYPLENVINEYKQAKYNKLYYRKLECDRGIEFHGTIKKSYELIKDDNYDLILTDWLKAEFNINVGNTQKTDTFWCSALIAYLYVQMGFLNKDVPWTIIAPNQFCSSDKNKLNFKNCTLQKEQLIAFNSKSKS